LLFRCGHMTIKNLFLEFLGQCGKGQVNNIIVYFDVILMMDKIKKSNARNC